MELCAAPLSVSQEWQPEVVKWTIGECVVQYVCYRWSGDFSFARLNMVWF